MKTKNLILLPILKWAKDIRRPKIKIICKLKFLISNPCKVANIFHIETKKIKKNEDINGNKIKFLVFIYPLS